MSRFSRDELQAAHDHFVEVANGCARSGDWRAWAELFTGDAEYFEHCFGRFRGPGEIYQWISRTMAQWPNRAMTSFPHEWCVCDVERGWWVCKILNRFEDPGDGRIYEEANITVLHYAGGMKFSYEEDAYNPANFAPVVTAWLDAHNAHNAHAAADRSGPPADAPDQPAQDEGVEEADRESFPASDPPSSWAGGDEPSGDGGTGPAAPGTGER